MENVLLENAEIDYRNFSGRVTPFNERGERQFIVYLPNDVAEAMSRDGWNIKQTNPREEGDEPRPFVQCSIKFETDYEPAQVVAVTSRGRTTLDSGTVDMLDFAEITHVDLLIRPYNWTFQATGKTGVKAMVKSMFVTIHEDPLQLKYADVPVIGQTPEG